MGCRRVLAGWVIAVVAAGCGEGGPVQGPDAAPEPPGLDPFDLGALHQVDIQVAERDLAQLDLDVENRVACTFTFDGVTVERAAIRKKGGYGSPQPLAGKPGFSVKLDELVPGQELGGFDKLILNNAVQDPTFLHEHLGYEIYRRAGIPAHRTAYAQVTFNGEDKGIYVLLEPVDRKFLRAHFGEGNQEGNLYEGPCCVDFVYQPDAIELKHEVEEMRSRADLYALAALVRDAPDAQLAAELPDRLDVDGFVTGYAIDAVLVHWDGYAFNVNNHYIYHDPAADRFVFMPHGMDQLLGDELFDPFTPPIGRLAQRVRELAALDERFRAAVFATVDGAWDTPLLLARIDRAAELVHAAAPGGERTRADLASFDANLQGTRDAVVARQQRVQSIADAVCGDGAVAGLEQCDDGGNADGDGCTAGCTVEFCGDGVVQAGLGESCDDPDCLPDCSGPATCVELARDARTFSICPMARSAFDARALCAAQGGALALPRDAAENAWLIAAALGVFPRIYWIGLSDEAVEGVYVGPDGAPPPLFDWAPGKPDNLDWQDCVVIDSDHEGHWNDKDCAEPFGFVCAR